MAPKAELAKGTAFYILQVRMEELTVRGVRHSPESSGDLKEEERPH